MIFGIFASSRKSGICIVVARVLAAAGAADFAEVRRLARRFVAVLAAVLAAVDGEVAALLRAMLAAPCRVNPATLTSNAQSDRFVKMLSVDIAPRWPFPGLALQSAPFHRSPRRKKGGLP